MQNESSEPAETGNELGTFVYENWRSALTGAPADSTVEYPLFSDGRVTGEIAEGLGPYQVFNCIADVSLDPHRPVLMLRVSYHAQWSYRDLETTDVARYHGGTTSDEFAALLSLCFGIRLKAGNPTRWFSKDGDPRGRPWSFREAGQPDPTIATTAWGPIVPAASGQHQLERTRRLAEFPQLSPNQSIAVVRAARLYQDALWVAESQPALAWLLLVSAVEAAAGEWRRGQDPPAMRLQASKPHLAALLEEHGGPDLVERAAAMLVDSLGATTKFIKFCITFLPAAPSVRPSKEHRVPWTKSYLRVSLGTIYNYRSIALHEGIPFPAPMCTPPGIYGDALAERLAYGGAGAMGGIWSVSDLPMFLHVFEHIARNALLSWWDSLAPPAGAPPEGADSPP